MTALTYGLLLIKNFKYSGVKLDDSDKVVAIEFVDVVSLTHSRLKDIIKWSA